MANTVGANQPFRYRGYVYDEETGWYYLQSRYYDPTTCRFISADALLSTGQGVIGHNAFAYCLNNPVMMTDDSGCCPFFIPFCPGCLANMLIAAGTAISCFYGIKTFAPTLFHSMTAFHYETRDSLNGEAPSYEEISAVDSGWYLLPEEQSIYHNNGIGKPELKFVHPDGREFVFDGDTKELITDSKFRGTYNYSPAISPKIRGIKGNLGDYADYGVAVIGHFVFDMLPYYILGNDR